MTELSNETLTVMINDLTQEVRQGFSEMKEDMKAKHGEVRTEFENVKKRQDHTNGDVKTVKLWIAGIVGGATVATVMFGILGFVLKEQVDFFLHPENKIREAVDQAIKNAEIEIEIK